MAISFNLKFDQEIPERAKPTGAPMNEDYQRAFNAVLTGEAKNACFTCETYNAATRLANSLRNAIKTKALELAVTQRKESVYLIKAAAVA